MNNRQNIISLYQVSVNFSEYYIIFSIACMLRGNLEIHFSFSHYLPQKELLHMKKIDKPYNKYQTKRSFYCHL